MLQRYDIFPTEDIKEKWASGGSLVEGTAPEAHEEAEGRSERESSVVQFVKDSRAAGLGKTHQRPFVLGRSDSSASGLERSQAVKA
jgi:hypothetical protein